MTDRMKDDWNQRARSDARFYIATSTDGSDRAFDESGRRDVALFFEGIEDLLTPQAVVLDIGCGIGRMDRYVAPRVKRLVGIDVSGEMIIQARARLAELDNVEFLECDGQTIPLSDSLFGLVFSHIVFQHMPRRFVECYMNEAHRVLRPGGSFVFQMPEAPESAPDDPPDDDSFEMRFYTETAVRTVASAADLECLGVSRFPVSSPRLDFNQMRFHVRRPA